MYELSNSEHYCHIIMNNYLINDLGMHSLTDGLAYFINCVHEKLSNMMGTHVDDLIAAGKDEFQEKAR